MALALRTKPEVYRRYWARAYAGWPRFVAAGPGPAHHALADLERAGRVSQLVTQNVDGLHQRAGSRAVIDLHGRLDAVVCLECGDRRSRAVWQDAIAACNPGWSASYVQAPDGDAEIDDSLITLFTPPLCERCGGLVKPDVVFFGENVPVATFEAARCALAESDALLAVGTSLMVYSGFRFVLQAREAGLPVAIVNRGRTRGDDFAELKVEGDLGTVLGEALASQGIDRGPLNGVLK